MKKQLLIALFCFMGIGAASAQTTLPAGSNVNGNFTVGIPATQSAPAINGNLSIIATTDNNGTAYLQRTVLTYPGGGTNWTMQNRWGDLQLFPDGDDTYRQIKFTSQGHVVFPRKVSIGGVTCTTPSACAGDNDMHINNLMLAVGGRVGARYGVHVLNVGAAWPDYVFAPRYQLAGLPQVEEFIQANHHLPGIPSEAEVQANGVELVTMQAALLKKVEELTLYVITLQKQNDALQTRVLKLEQ